MSQLPALKAEYAVLTILKWMEALLLIPKEKDLLNSSLPVRNELKLINIINFAGIINSVTL